MERSRLSRSPATKVVRSILTGLARSRCGGLTQGNLILSSASEASRIDREGCRATFGGPPGSLDGWQAARGMDMAVEDC